MRPSGTKCLLAIYALLSNASCCFSINLSAFSVYEYSRLTQAEFVTEAIPTANCGQLQLEFASDTEMAISGTPIARRH